MKVMIPATETDAKLNTLPSKVLENAKSFIVYDRDEDTFVLHANETKNTEELALKLKELGVNDVIVSMVCNDCIKSIKDEGIEIWQDDSSITVREAYQKFMLGAIIPMRAEANHACAFVKVEQIATEKVEA